MRTKMASTKSVLHCKFDFAQNLPLPYIPVNSQFYAQLLWFHAFNVHTHKV